VYLFNLVLIQIISVAPNKSDKLAIYESVGVILNIYSSVTFVFYSRQLHSCQLS